MSFKLRKPAISSGAIAGAVGVAFLVGSAGGAYAGSLIHTHNIAAHAVTWTKLSTGVQGRINKPVSAPAAALPARLAGSVVTDSGAPVTVTTIGGSFATGATQVGSMHLAAGQYLISSDAFFDRSSAGDTASTDAGAPQTYLQLAIRGDDGSTWGTDDGTCFTGAFPVGDREATCSTTHLVTVPSGGMDVNVKAFGYNSDRSATGSGDYNVAVNVTAIAVG
ncbi:MAG TPA: hypothetical protein VN088_11980 [Nocardioides sp.]|nr:hypothetical protein [Nocardioides sp.]